MPFSASFSTGRLAWLRSLLFAVVMSATALGAPRLVRAEPRAEINDVVVLTDGSFVRATLGERAAGQSAVLPPLGGQLRRFEAADYRYGGPADSMPQASPPPGVDASGQSTPSVASSP